MNQFESNLNLFRKRMIQSVIVIGSFSISQYFILRKLSGTVNFCLADSIALFVLGTIFIGIIFNLQKNHHSKQVFNSQNIGTVVLFSSILLYLNYFSSSFFLKNNELLSEFFWPFTGIKFIMIILLLFVFVMLFWIEEQRKQESQFQKFAL